jgi:hypothetical protein
MTETRPVLDQDAAQSMHDRVREIITAALGNCEDEEEARAILSGAMSACAHLYWVMRPPQFSLEHTTVTWATAGREYFIQVMAAEQGHGQEGSA